MWRHFPAILLLLVSFFAGNNTWSSLQTVLLVAMAAGTISAIRWKWLSPGAALHALSLGIFCLFSGYSNAIVLLFLFLLFGSVLSRSGTELKTGRTLEQVWANAGVFIFLLVLSLFFETSRFDIAALCSLTCAFSDTAASAVGTKFPKRTYDIVTWKPVASGTDGGVTAMGFWASFFAAAIFAGASLLLFTVPLSAAAAIGGLGFLGSVVDSYLGAIFQNRKNRFSLTNDGVNLISTAVAALLFLLMDFYGMV